MVRMRFGGGCRGGGCRGGGADGGADGGGRGIEPLLPTFTSSAIDFIALSSLAIMNILSALKSFMYCAWAFSTSATPIVTRARSRSSKRMTFLTCESLSWKSLCIHSLT